MYEVKKKKKKKKGKVKHAREATKQREFQALMTIAGCDVSGMRLLICIF